MILRTPSVKTSDVGGHHSSPVGTTRCRGLRDTRWGDSQGLHAPQGHRALFLTYRPRNQKGLQAPSV